MRPSLVINRVTEETGADGQSIKLTPELVSSTREGQPETLRHRLEGDLDNILLKALRKEARRRYASVEQFADDIQRHLDGLPVLARKDTIRYRTAKFVKRHKAGVAAAVLIAVSLIGGIVATAWQAHIAQIERAKAVQRFNDVRQLSNSLIFDMDDAIADLPGSTPARKILVSNAVRYLDLLSKEAKDDFALQRELATAYRKLSDVQGNQFRGNLGDTPGAMESLRKVVSLREGLAAANPTNHSDQFDLATSYRMLAQMLVLTGDLQGGMQYAVKAHAIIVAVAKADPNNLDVLDKLEDVYELIGDIQGGNGLSANLGDTASALENHRRAMEIAQRVLKLKPTDPAARRSVAIYDIKIADDLAKQGDRAGALTNYWSAMEIYKAISAGSLSTIYTREINLVYTRIGDTQLMEGDSRGALKSYRAAMDLAENLASADPQNALAREDLATGYAMLGKASGDSGNTKDGLAFLQKGIAIIEKEVAHDPQHSDKRRILSLLYVWHGQLLAHTGNLDKALAEYRKTTAILEAITSAEPTDVDARITLAATNAKIGDLLAARGESPAATELYQKVIPVVEPFALSTPPNPQAQYTLADTYSGLGSVWEKQASRKGLPISKQVEHWTQARSWYERSLAAWRQVNGPGKMSPSGFDTTGPNRVKDKLALCETTLRKLKPVTEPW
jgi:non-specific serine/threonine protein kinase/serine/threonine-protein kinase